MEAQEFLSAMKSGRMSRRDILQMLTAAGLTIAIEDAFAAVRPDECRNYLTAAGYDAFDPT